MKKLLTLALAGAMSLSVFTTAFAATAVSQMATTEGGKSLAACAQAMDKGVSECAKMPTCAH